MYYHDTEHDIRALLPYQNEEERLHNSDQRVLRGHHTEYKVLS